MRAKFVLLAIAVQFLILGWMAGQREWIVRTSPTVWLRTTPVDPRDLFRGDFVRLNYEIASIHQSAFGPTLAGDLALRAKAKDRPYRRNRELVLYTALAVNPESGTATPTSVDLVPPVAGLFIKGRVQANGYSPAATLPNIAYGIDAYFVQQGKGQDLERRAPLGTPDGFQVPMEIQVALGRDGTAVILGHRWGALGIKVTTRNTPSAGNHAGLADATDIAAPLPPIEVSLCNADDKPRAVVLPADLRTLRLEQLDGWNGHGETVTPPRVNPRPLQDADARVLQPGETVTVRIDPNLPEWFVRTDDKDYTSLRQHTNDYRSYRIVYAAPTASDCAGLKDARLIIHGDLPARTISSYELR